MFWQGPFRGLVVNNSDPEGLNRIRVQVPQVLGTATSGWALPIPADTWGVPSVGSQVLVTFEGGDLSHPLYFSDNSGVSQKYIDNGDAAVQANLNTHEAATTSVHGIPDTSKLLSSATVTAKGDLYVGTGNGTVGRFGVGTNGQYLVPDSTQTSGVRWRTPHYIDVRSYGATGDGSTDDTTAINNAVAAAVAGNVIVFPPGTYIISSPITGKTGVRYQGQGATIHQNTQFQAAFDLFNADNCAVMGLTLINTASPTSMGSSFRGDAGYGFSAGVWSNGSGHLISNLVITNFAMGVNLNSSDGTTNVGNHVQRVGNIVENVRVSGANHGVLLLNQIDATVRNVTVVNHVDSSAGANPMHALYVTGTSSDTSANLTVVGCRDESNSTGQGFQVKFTNGLVMADCLAQSTLGLLNLMDVNDVRISNIESLSDNSTAGSVVVQTSTNVSNRINMVGVTITKAADATAEFSVQANDSTFSDITINTVKNGLNTATSDVNVRGTRVTLRNLKLRNSGTSNARAIYVGGSGYTTADVNINGFEIDNYRNLVDVYTTATGTLIAYDPALQRRIAFGTSNYIQAVSGSATYQVSRRPTSNVYAVTAASTQYPLGGLETVSVFNVTTSGAITMREPLFGAPVGAVHEIVVWNNTAAALGTWTWNSLYKWASGSAPTLPPAGSLSRYKFMWDGTNWRDITVMDSGWVNLTLATGYVGDTVDIPQARLTGDRVELRGTVKTSSGANLSGTAVVANIPTGGAIPFPTVAFPAALAGSTGSGMLRGYLGTDGSVTVTASLTGSCNYVSLKGLDYRTT